MNKKYTLRLQRYVSHGLCVNADMRPVVPGKTMCIKCMKRTRINSKNRHNRLLSAGRCIDCGNKALKKFSKCRSCFDRHNASRALRRNEVKLEIMAHYCKGKIKCQCCGEHEVKFLVIDHKDGGGTKHRKEIGRGASIYPWLKNNNYPKGFQVLCANCNHGKAINGGICPHIK